MPIAWIYWIILPGTIGNNRFGAQPEPNNLVINILGILCILFILLSVFSFLGTYPFIKIMSYIRSNK
jgi:hypothetical protein